jgi:hypothetical protein
MDDHMFYGIPQIIWDDLCEKAEEVLCENNLGNHLVGVYPAGNRIYGIESESPGLMCLYVDSVEPMIDPLSNYHKATGFTHYSIGHGCSPIIMVDLYKWVQWLFNRKCYRDWKDYAFLNLLPFGNHVIHEDESISEIMKWCHQGLKERGFLTYGDFFYDKTGCIRPSYMYPSRYLYLRTCLMTATSGYFNPNINAEWDTVQEFSNDFMNPQADKAAIKEILDSSDIYGSVKTHIANSIINNVGWEIWRKNNSQTTDKTLREVSKAVMNFYRFQL